jgi:hypothetical protein
VPHSREGDGDSSTCVSFARFRAAFVSAHISASKSALIFDSALGNPGAEVVLDLEPHSLEVRDDQVEEGDDWGKHGGDMNWYDGMR